MELTEEYIKNLEFVGAGNFGTLYRNGNVIYKLYKEEVKDEGLFLALVLLLIS